MSWRYAAAATVGTSHVRDGLPLQDAFACRVAVEPEPTLIAVVSDGAGSASEGAAGSAFMCTSLVQDLEAGLRSASPDPVAWLTEGITHVRAALLAEADQRAIPARQFAATLLCAVVAPAWSVFAQIGDGAIVTSEPGTGGWSWLFWPQRGEYANSTSFITDDRALDGLRVEAVPHGQPEIAMFTDGLQHLLLHYAEQTVHSPFFEKMMAPIRRSAGSGEDAGLSQALASYLRSPTIAERADDDLTLLMATRLKEVPVGTAAP